MNFFGKHFLYDGISCEAYDLMLYDIDGGGDDENDFASTVTIEEETVGNRWRPYFYGVKHDGKLTFDITFGVTPRRIDEQRFLDRYELSVVASWLTGHDGYKCLDIEQDDMRFVRYRAIITDFKVVSFGQIPWALTATVECDSPYAYMYPQTFRFTPRSMDEAFSTGVLYNPSSLNGFYMPTITILQQGSRNNGTFKIVNTSDNDREFLFTGLPAGTGLITVQNDTCLITCANGLNLYPYFNNKFFRLVKGVNNLRFTGVADVEITCEFPINTGG